MLVPQSTCRAGCCGHVRTKKRTTLHPSQDGKYCKWEWFSLQWGLGALGPWTQLCLHVDGPDLESGLPRALPQVLSQNPLPLDQIWGFLSPELDHTFVSVC